MTFIDVTVDAGALVEAFAPCDAIVTKPSAVTAAAVLKRTRFNIVRTIGRIHPRS